MVKRKTTSLRQLLCLLLIMLAGASLRLYQLDVVPPGLTHDEADHGLDAWRIVKGDRPVYLPTANGREPLFDYATAILMSVIGRSYLAGRLTAMFFSLFFLAATYGWSKRLFSHRIAMLATAGLALSFWPVMISRQMLRTVTLPALLALSLFFFLLAREKRGWWPTIASAIFLGLSFYSYIPARALWLLLPLLVFWWLLKRQLDWLMPGKLLLILILAALIAVPLFSYFQQNPAAETRIGQLQQPLTDALNGDFTLLWENSLASLKLFSFSGDTAWRYNIAGRPWLGPLNSILFYPGLLLALYYLIKDWRGQERFGAGSFLSLGWLAIGFAPAAITGPELATTQAIGVLSVLYLFPALALDWGWQWAIVQQPAGRTFIPWLVGIAYLLLAFGTSQAYFQTWANHPQVRLQYESTLVTTLNQLQADGLTNVAISTTQPGPYHAQAVAALILRQEPSLYQWFDGRSSLAVPPEEGYLVGTGLAPLRSELINGQPLQEILTRADDIDRPVFLYDSNVLALPLQQLQQPTSIYQFGDAVNLLGYWLPTDQFSAGDTLQYLTAWQVNALPAVEWILFTHVSDANGVLVAQQDLLAVPTSGWRIGDRFYQLHEISLPDDFLIGSYQIRNGFYFCPVRCEDGTVRVQVWEQTVSAEAKLVGDILDVTSVDVVP